MMGSVNSSRRTFSTSSAVRSASIVYTSMVRTRSTPSPRSSMMLRWTVSPNGSRYSGRKVTSRRWGMDTSEADFGAGEGPATLTDLGADLGMQRFISEVTDDLVDPGSDAPHLGLLHAA